MSDRSDVAERFWSKVDKAGPIPAAAPHLGPCWVWVASLGTAGYGQFRLDGQPVGAHRVSHILTKGPIPAGLEVDHLCFNRPCVRPSHLEAVTKPENIRRGTSPTAVNGRKEICDHGHEFVDGNVYFRKDRPGRRQCRECSRIAKRRPTPSLV